MLVIRNEQIATLESEQPKVFEDHMVKHLREFFPELTENMAETRLRQFIRDEIETAHEFDIEEADQTAVYISAMFALRPDSEVDTEPTWVKELLADLELSAEEKIEQLEAWIEEELEEMETNESK